ncbi:hypothetical protein ASE66_10750 [Bosea sp. Root483D1]|uniref:helix-turn-helix domain-containing protein n=1 Tax=Bosea sp. Root483D1 TaxID=1736544 RepID=UPI000709B37B|nr:helix-turn-helix domain-containing protein [Bosea sp. Root483D1]KRE16220.1 hypothetical protein ASE66_10750 [Bosea sp. Root483D1]
MQADWELVRAPPRPDLAGAVLGYTGYREHRAEPILRREVPVLVLPLIVNFAAPFMLSVAGGQSTAPQGFAAGLIDRPVLVSSTGLAACVQVDFTPAGAYGFFQLDQRDMAGRIVDLDDLGELRLLGPRLRECRSWADCFALLDRVISQRLARGRSLSPEVAGGLAWLTARRGRGRMRDLAAAAGWSERHLTRRFVSETGVGPKTIARILRFEHARELAGQQEPGGWAAIAQAAGYADQAHMTREFAALCGLPPTALARNDAGEHGILESA